MPPRLDVPNKREDGRLRECARTSLERGQTCAGPSESIRSRTRWAQARQPFRRHMTSADGVAFALVVDVDVADARCAMSIIMNRA